MYSIRHSTKKVLFDKGKEESLTPEEQAEFDEIIDWIWPAKIIVEPKEPVWDMALRIYNYIKKEHTTTWAQVERMLLQETEPVATNNTIKNPARFWTKWITVASFVLIVGYYIRSQNRSSCRRQKIS